MELICSAMGVCTPERPGQGIADISNAGFKAISLDIGMYCSGYELEHHGGEMNGFDKRDKNPIIENPSEMSSCFEAMLAQCEKKGLHTLIARAPFLLENTKRTDLNDLLFQLSEESIRFCGDVSCKAIIVQPMFAGIAPEDEWKVNCDYYLRLAETARENNIMILLENQCRNINGHLIRGICSDGTIAAKWIDELNDRAGEQRFGFCMNVGTCSLCGQNMDEFAATIGQRMKAVVLRDCDGHEAAGLLPFTCSYGRQSRTDWLSLIRGLRKLGFDGYLVLEMADTVAAFSPLLRPQLMALAKAVMEYFRFQIEIESVLRKYRHIVLFGAGNMCRNYMKYYGEEYPPLFTCDNNKSLWGTKIGEVEVKNPEELRNIPKDCAIFLCNVYYREIEEQLRNMGILNPIEYFNDEYLPYPSFEEIDAGGK